jgi:hypothetical protein
MRPHDERYGSGAGRRRSGGRWRGTPRRCRSLDGRPQLRLIVSPRRPARLGVMHPALPSTLAFAAVSIAALAFASAIDAASAVARTAVAVGSQLRAARFI